jgi:D-lactate dehydrogenase (cytochrome)
MHRRTWDRRRKMNFMCEEHGDALEVMRAIKKALDPDNRMNSGKIVDIAGG